MYSFLFIKSAFTTNDQDVVLEEGGNELTGKNFNGADRSLKCFINTPYDFSLAFVLLSMEQMLCVILTSFRYGTVDRSKASKNVNS